MDLNFTEEQEMLRDLVRSICTDNWAAVREVEDDPAGYPAKLWQQLAEADLIGLLIPEAHGGSGMSLLEGAIVYQELGRGLAPTPHFVSAVLAAGVLARAGTDEQRQAWLPRIASGESILSIAWLEPESGFGPRGVHAGATPVGDGYVVTGEKWHVAFASSAERLVVLARTDDGIGLFLIDPHGPGATLEQQLTIGSDAQYQVVLDGAPAERIGTADWATWDATMHEAVILLAAYAVGGTQAVLDTTVQYSKDRVQFDKPLGAFQALAHDMADARTAVDGAEVLVWEAAWAASAGHDIAKLAPMAKLFACQTFRDTSAMAQQIHGGIGFTLECDVQLYFRRAKQLQISWWGDRHLEELIAAQVLDT